MNANLKRNDVDRVPSRATLIPTVIPWRPKNRTMPDGWREQRVNDQPKTVVTVPREVFQPNDAPDTLPLWVFDAIDAAFPIEGKPINAAPSVLDARYARPWTPWTGDANELVRWFQQSRDHLPVEPFRLKPGVWVFDPAKFSAAMDVNIQDGANTPRASGLLDDLQWLKRVFGGVLQAPQN